MDASEFHYRMPRRVGGARVGSHPGLATGSGGAFVAHTSLFRQPDPRRIDIRASLRRQVALDDDWLVRVHRQRSGITLHLVADVSASMRFGEPQTKLERVAQFAECLGRSVHRLGDRLGLIAFDAHERGDLHLPAQRSRGTGTAIAAALRQAPGGAGGLGGLVQASERLAGRDGIVFIASDFHWALDGLDTVLDRLGHAFVVPMVVWDRAETAPPRVNGIAPAHDAETHARRTLWLRPIVRQRWSAGVAQRRAELERRFASRGLRPFWMDGGFDADAMSRHFLEAGAI